MQARVLQAHVTAAAGVLAELSTFAARDEALQMLLAMTDYLVGGRDAGAELVRRATRLLRGGHPDSSDEANGFRVVDAFLDRLHSFPVEVRPLLVESDPRLEKASEDAIRAACERYAAGKSRAGTLADLYLAAGLKEKRTKLHQRIESALKAPNKRR